MSLRPIDFQVMMPKVNEVGQLNQNIMNRNDAANQQLANNLQKNIKESMHQVSSTKKAEGTKVQVNDEGSSKNRKYKNGKKTSGKSDSDDEEENVGSKGSTIDLRI